MTFKIIHFFSPGEIFSFSPAADRHLINTGRRCLFSLSHARSLARYLSLSYPPSDFLCLAGVTYGSATGMRPLFTPAGGCAPSAESHACSPPLTTGGWDFSHKRIFKVLFCFCEAGKRGEERGEERLLYFFTTLFLVAFYRTGLTLRGGGV